MFHGLFIKKYSFDFVRGCIFRVIRVKTKMSKVRKNIFGIFYFFITEKNAVQTRKKLCKVYGEGVINSKPSIENWFSKFRFDNFDIKDARSERPIKANEDKLKALIEINRRITIREIATRLNLSNSTVYDHIKRFSVSLS